MATSDTDSGNEQVPPKNEGTIWYFRRIKNDTKPKKPPSLLLHDIFQLIDDGMMFTIAKKCRPSSTGKNFGLAFQNLSIDYLEIIIRKQTYFHPFVTLSVGTFDQKLFLKTRRRPKFQSKLTEVIAYLFNHGVEKLIAILPFPDPGIGLFDIRAWKFYERILKAYALMAGVNTSKLLVLDYTHLVAYKANPEAGVLYQQDGIYRPNLSIKKVKLGLSHDCWVIWDPILAITIYRQLKKIAAHLKSPTVIREEAPPKCCRVRYYGQIYAKVSG